MSLRIETSGCINSVPCEREACGEIGIARGKVQTAATGSGEKQEDRGWSWDDNANGVAKIVVLDDPSQASDRVKKPVLGSIEGLISLDAVRSPGW